MRLKLLPLLLLTAIAGFAQTTTPALSVTDPLNIWALGLSWNQSASASMSQQFAGTAMYAREQNTAGTYAFTVIDAVPTSFKPFTTVTNMGVGIGQKLPFTILGFTPYATAAAGPSWSGANTGWNWNGGFMATRPLKNKWWWGPAARVIRSSVNQNSGNQYIFSAMVGMNP